MRRLSDFKIPTQHNLHTALEEEIPPYVEDVAVGMDDFDEAYSVKRVEDTPTLPPYMLTDPKAVGYPDLNFQESIYKLAIHGVLPSPFSGSILDLGAGRADFYQFVKNEGFAGTYVGVEQNALLVEAAKQKWDIQIKHANFLVGDLSEHDWIFCNFSLNDISGSQKWIEFERQINRFMDAARRGVVLILPGIPLEGVVESWPIPNVVDSIAKFGWRFAIDNTLEELEGIYKVVILK